MKTLLWRWSFNVLACLQTQVFAQKGGTSQVADGDKTVQPTGRARGRARGRPRTAEELAAMRRPGETTTTPATTAQGDHDCYRGMLVQPGYE